MSADRAEQRAWELGRQYADKHPYDTVKDESNSEKMHTEAIAMGCRPWWFDVFKYGAQTRWREKGELK